MTERTVRTRIGISKTSTGKFSWDCTIEVQGEDSVILVPRFKKGEPGSVIYESETQQTSVLSLSDALVAELRARYPEPGESSG